jgi:DNA-binding NarL/FixJ family response regulator
VRERLAPEGEAILNKAQSFQLDRRDVAILAERVTDDRIALARVWQELRAGQCQIVDSFITEERYYLLLSPPRDGKQRLALSDRRRSLLEGVLCGQSIKALAFDFGLSQSTVFHEAKAALYQLGMECTPCRVNPLVTMLARAALDNQLSRSAKIACFADTETMFRVVGTARPDVRLAPILSPAEFAVIRGLIEGRNYLEIAANRGTSTRTVANQLAAAFRRLGVSGRGSLLNHIVFAAEALA